MQAVTLGKKGYVGERIADCDTIAGMHAGYAGSTLKCCETP